MAGEPDGPFLKAAFFCESALEEKTGVLSAIRIVERLEITVPPDASVGPGVVPPTPVELTTVLLVGTGDNAGRRTLSVRLVSRSPSGQEASTEAFPIELGGDEARIILPLKFLVGEAGRYWFDVLFDDALVTRIPLAVRRSVRHDP